MRQFLIFIIMMLAVIKPAYAYLDPGSASLALQAILAVVAGGLATFKFWWHKVVSFFKKSPTDNSD